MDPSTSASPVSSALFDEYNQKLQQAVLKATRHAAYMPPDVSFHRSMDAELSKDLDEFSAGLLLLTNRLLSLASSANSTTSSRDKAKSKLKTQDDVVDNFQPIVVDCMDQLLERTVSICGHRLTAKPMFMFVRMLVWMCTSAEQNHPPSSLIKRLPLLKN